MEIQGVPEARSTVRIDRVQAAVDCDSALSKGAVGVRVTGEASCPEGCDLITAGNRQELLAVVQQGVLFIQRVVGKMLAFTGCAGRAGGGFRRSIPGAGATGYRCSRRESSR